VAAKHRDEPTVGTYVDCGLRNGGRRSAAVWPRMLYTYGNVRCMKKTLRDAKEASCASTDTETGGSV
jgi:hypothetical protein